MIFLRVFNFALHALSVNKLRTFLSLLGITIGIFTIITVFTIVDSLERNIRGSINDLGSDVVYVQKWPWGGGGGEYKWWKYFQRPEPSFRELKTLKKRMTTASSLAFAYGLSGTLKYRTNSVERATIFPVSHDYYDIWGFDLASGRYFSDLESSSGSPVAVIGHDLADGLFGSSDPIGKSIKLLGRKVTIIGVFAKQGSSLIGQDTDETIYLPVNYARGMMNVNNRNGAVIMALAKPGVSVDEMKDELQGTMRSVRRLKPKADDNFALNEISVISSGLDALFDAIGFAGGIIGIFSILVGGFGIANIMFVSVKERTGQIGVQKSLGAKNHFILSQFLLESVILCLLGGIVGLLIIYGGLALFKMAAPDFGLEIALSTGNVIQGLVLSVIIGIISGFIPAWQASRLNPVDAIRAGQ
jgi:putative ABC transport system permease protein